MSTNFDQPTSNSRWRFQKVVDEDTQQLLLEWNFPTETGGSGTHRVSFKLTENLRQLRDELLEFGAKFPPGDKIAFLRRMTADEAGTTSAALLTRRTGYRDKGFIFPKGQGVGDVPTSIWDSDATPDLPIGIERGTLAGWNARIGQACEFSTPVGFAVPAVLACSCLRYASVTETAVFNFAAPSSTGKTTLAKVGASVFGAPSPLPNWNNTERGLEELAAYYNDLALILNDTEAFPDDAAALRKALKAVAQVVPEGQSRTRSASVSGRRKQVPALRWRVFGISTSIKTAEELAREANSSRSEGERVRLIDIPIPPREAGGIFDLLPEDGPPAIQQSKARVEQLEAALAEEHGTLIRPWISYLLANDPTAILQQYMDDFVSRMAPAGDGFEVRLAKKFALPYAAGRLAVKAGILDWPERWVRESAETCYTWALKAIRTEAEQVSAALAQLLVAVEDPDLVPSVRNGGKVLTRVWDTALGVRAQLSGKEVIALRSDRIQRLARDRQVARRLLRRLQEADVLLPGHGGKSTRQPLTLRISGEDQRPRFWVLDAERLAALAKAQQG